MRSSVFLVWRIGILVRMLLPILADLAQWDRGREQAQRLARPQCVSMV